MNKKIVLPPSLLMIFVLLAACTTNIAIETNADTVASTATEIADFDLPADYVPEFSTSLEGYTLVSYSPGNGPSHLYLIQSKKESDGAELERMLTQLAPGSSDSNTRMTVIENSTATVRGQEVAVVISEGMNSESVSYRQVTVGFQGNGGPALLVISEPVERWNQESVDAFIASIH